MIYTELYPTVDVSMCVNMCECVHVNACQIADMRSVVHEGSIEYRLCVDGSDR